MNDSDLKCDSISDIKSKPKILQLLMYGWLFNKNSTNAIFPFFAGVINLRAVNFDVHHCIVSRNKLLNQSDLNQFEQELISIILDMFNPQEKFEHAPRDEDCFFCD